MSIKQQGGVFGRNPTFNDVTIEGELTFDGDIDINSDLKIDGDLEVTNQAGIGVAPGTDRLHVANGTFRLSGNSIETVIGYSSYAVFGTTTNHDLQVRTNNVETGRFKPGIGLAFPSGYGIDFSATAGTGTSELFDDYEEGYVTGITMTPSTSGTITMLAAYTTLSYTKVGRIVTITGNLVTSSSSSPVGTSVAIGTLPFTVAAGDQTAFAAGNAVTYYEGGGVYSSTPIRVTESATAITWLIDASTVSGVKELYINLSYVAA